MISKGDKILVIVVLVCTVLFFGVKYLVDMNNQAEQKILNVSLDGKVIREINLSKVKEKSIIQIKGNLISKIEIDNGRVRFVNAICPDKICEKTGWLEKPGQIAVCLPNKVIIKIVGEDENLDAVAK